MVHTRKHPILSLVIILLSQHWKACNNKKTTPTQRKTHTHRTFPLLRLDKRANNKSLLLSFSATRSHISLLFLLQVTSDVRYRNARHKSISFFYLPITSSFDLRSTNSLVMWIHGNEHYRVDATYQNFNDHNFFFLDCNQGKWHIKHS